jgi:DNA-binding response OmpR family regulator
MAMATILVIEDDVPTLETYGLVLRDAGHEVALAPTSRDGFEALRGQRYDLVLADLSLPDGTALELLDALQAARITVPVIVITGVGNLEIAVDAMRRGAIDYAVKPLIGDDLLSKIDWGLRYAATRDAPRLPPESHAHATTRWAALMVALLSAPRDVRTNNEWARLVGVSVTTLRDWCRMARTSAARSLALGRLLRAVYVSRGQHWQPAERLNVRDPRTLGRMLEKGGLPVDAPRVTIRDLLSAQSFVEDLDALLALRAALVDKDPTAMSG